MKWAFAGQLFQMSTLRRFNYPSVTSPTRFLYKFRQIMISSLSFSWVDGENRQKRGRPKDPVLHVAYATIVALFFVHEANAQPFEVPKPSEAPPVYHSVAYCKQSTTNSLTVMHLVQTVIAHGDLTDIAFIEKTFATKFRSDNYLINQNGQPNNGRIHYKADEVLGDPIHIDLFVNMPRARQIKLNSIAVMNIESQPLSDPNDNFFVDCLHISAPDFFSSFGGGFFLGFSTCCGLQAVANATSEQASPGKNMSKIYSDVSYNFVTKIINRIGIMQRP